LRCTVPTAIQTAVFNSVIKETAMQWTTPAYTDLRFGFEITMYIANR
jgi:coenzyme PQQ precursor peptide PqqA